MKIEFKYELKQEVSIKALKTKGIVIGCFYGDSGIQYQVAYFIDGGRKSTFLYEEELNFANLDDMLGFKSS